MNVSKKIGNIIRDIRERNNWSQEQLAEKLKTTQSAVARMESGDQNFTLANLEKLSEVLEQPLIHISKNFTDDLEIHGGKQLSGSIEVNTSKNGALGLMCASLLNGGTTILHQIPRIEEIKRMIEVFKSLNISVKWIDEHSLEIKRPAKLSFESLDIEAAKKMRSTIMLMGSLIHLQDEVRLPHAGGCRMGKRTVSAHAFGLEALGVEFDVTSTEYVLKTHNKKAAELTLFEASDTGMENIAIAAARMNGTTTIHFPQLNYMVQDVLGLLKAFGVTIEHKGTSLTITGVSEINKRVEYYNSPDPIEAMAFLSIGITTKSEITVTKCPIDFLRRELLILDQMGQKFTTSKQYVAKNGFTKLVDITVHPSELTAVADKIHPLPYPGVNVDNLPFFVPIAAMAHGQTLIHDWMWESRAIHFTKLNTMRAQIRLMDPHRVIINGPTDFKAGQIVCPPALRPSMIILVAMLGAPGVSTLRNVYAIKRGYENIAERLNAIGADIRALSEIV